MLALLMYASIDPSMLKSRTTLTLRKADLSQTLKEFRYTSHLLYRALLMVCRTDITDLTERGEYPRVGPSAKYAICSTRMVYLYWIFQYEVHLDALLPLVQRLVRGFSSIRLCIINSPSL